MRSDHITARNSSDSKRGGSISAVTPRLVVAALAAVALITIAACGGGSGSDVSVTPPPPPVPVASVVVAPASGNVTVGSALQLTATPLDAFGNALAGRAVAWSSSSTTIASVSSSGLVTALSAGIVTITATSEDKSGAAALTIANPVLTVAVAAGNSQVGVAGTALSDSLAVKVTDASGAPSAGRTVTWSATGGTVSPSTSVTNANGVAYAQEAIAASATTAAATANVVFGVAPAAFNENARPQASCSLVASAAAPRLNEGPTDYTDMLRPTGTLHAVMIFVDFSDAPAKGTTDSLYQALVPDAVAYFTEASYGRMTLDVTPIKTWFRMSKPSPQYGLIRGVTSATVADAGALQKAYMTEAMQLADSVVDFSKYDLVYIVPSDGSAGDFSPGFVAPPGGGIVMDGVEIRHGATFGSDIHITWPHYASTILNHETGHTFGLPDLYSFSTTTYPDELEFMGGWDIMGLEVPHEHYLAWQKLKLGWLEPSEITCIDGGSMEAVVTPTEIAGGLKALAFKVSPSKAYVVEVRQLLGMDAAACDKGVLIYTVDATVATGNGPIRLVPSVPGGTDPNKLLSCGPMYDATFDIGNGKPRTFTDSAAGVTVELVSEVGNAYRIRLRTSPH